MAILENPENYDNTINYVATLAFFCGISCVTLMLKFRGFKASLNIFNVKKNSKEHNVESGLCLSGAYRTSRDEFYGVDRVSEPPKKLTPSMVKLPSSEQARAVRPAKSTGDLSTPNNEPTQLRQSTPDVSADPRGEEDVQIPRNSRQSLKTQEKEQKKLAKQRLAEQKAREKQAAQEQAKQEKLRREREKKDVQAKPKKNKKPAPQPQQQPQPQIANPSAPAPMQYSTNTLESSISRSSGPPPYSAVPKPETVRNKNDTSGNVSFSKPMDTGSWDMISQHRQQISRTTNITEMQNKQVVMDLNYNFNNNARTSDARDNSEA